MLIRRLFFVTLLAASCSPTGVGNESSAGSAGSEETLVLTAASSGAGDCSYLWNGEAVTEQDILDKSVAAIEQAIHGVGGIENITEQAMPLVQLEAEANVPYACTGPALRQLERSGLVAVALKPAGTAGQKANFFMDPNASNGPFAIIRLTAGGMSWDNQPIDGVGLRERVRAESLNRPPVELVVAPAGDSGFRALHDALAAIRQGGMDAFLSGCSGTTGPIRETGPVC